MKVFKFGGASVKDVLGVKNVLKVLQLYANDNLLIVVSAMGKTTNALERLTAAYLNKIGLEQQILDEIKEYHYGIVDGLFPSKTHAVYTEINNIFAELEWIMEEDPTLSYNQTYDQIVSCGEVLSTKIVSAYLNLCAVENAWVDVRDIIKTDETYREGKVNWELTQVLSVAKLKSAKKVITQGFIGGTADNYTTTLGREGSDYSAAILAYCLDAESVTIWKDVAGVLNADPKHVDGAVLIPHLSYLDAIELAYYGATVIHPKTIKPLQNKNIPLFVKSFLNPENSGTIVNNDEITNPISSFIFKTNQALVSISPKDFSFIVEENLSEVFAVFSEQKIKINLMQNSAISFSICIDNAENNLQRLVAALSNKYKVLYNEQLRLTTVRHYNSSTLAELTKGKAIILEQKSRNTIQFIIKEQ